MIPTAAALPTPTKPQLETWQSTHLDDAASRWHAGATESEDLLEQHLSTIAAPGGAEWFGDAKDAAFYRASTDLAVVREQSAVQRAGADIAARGGADVRAAQQAALNAIIAASWSADN